MYVVDGIAYAGERQSEIKVCGVRPMVDHKLWVRFNTGEAKVFDFAPLLSSPAFVSLADESFFREVYIDYGVTVWGDGDIDIAPERLYRDGVAVDSVASA